jgi:hypothetical protein
MGELSDKTKNYTLYACTNLECPVATFIGKIWGQQATGGSVSCPYCENEGILIRHPYDGRGAPGWTGRAIDE